jgi:hypothetical protein
LGYITNRKKALKTYPARFALPSTAAVYIVAYNLILIYIQSVMLFWHIANTPHPHPDPLPLFRPESREGEHIWKNFARGSPDRNKANY